ncbi:MAG: hypothetical protein COB76_04925, partial [Alphaproteobacteria bacterium]
MLSDILDNISRDNPWLETPGRWKAALERRIPVDFVARTQPGVAALSEELPIDRATLLIGPRQAGKSTWVWNELRGLGPQMLFVDCEAPAMQGWCRDASAFVADAADLLPSGGAIFLEEAQHLEDAGLFVKGIVDRGLR